MTPNETMGCSGPGWTRLIPYALTLYYLEIISLMFALLFLYGRAAAIISGAALSLLWAYHIVRFHYGDERHRKIQLVVIDLHAAFTAGYLFYTVMQGPGADAAAPLVLGARGLILFVEIPLFFILTDDGFAARFRHRW
ncbi:MAG: hypothetical protein JW838_00185 [Spirochaetes bacterium]|nr:hypothetical protein [Spirochaetota bacterium]